MRILCYYRGNESLGMGYLMSMLKTHGHEIDLIFDPGFDDNLFIRVPALRWLNNHQALLERACAFKPDLVAVGSLTNLWPYAREMMVGLKRALGVPIVVGGHHAQALPEYVLRHPEVDFVCPGEGEIALLELVNRMEQKGDITSVPGMWAKKDGEIFRNALGPLENDLDRFPFPEKQLWHEYGVLSRHLEIMTGRGCAFKCTFCDIHYQREIFAGMGKFLRKRSVPNVMEEIKVNLNEYDLRGVIVHDDSFTTNPSWVEEFCEAYRKEVNLPWYCFGYPTTIKPKIINAMKAANCMTIFMGLDSGAAEIRRRVMDRPMSDELILQSAKLIKNAGIRLQASCVYGSPGETAEQMWKTLSMVEQIQPDQCSSYILYPFPKTKIYEESVRLGYLDEKGQEDVREGRSSIHHYSVLNHPEKDLAETLAKVTPYYVRSPKILRPMLRYLIHRHMKQVALMMYLLLFPFSFPHLGGEGVKITLRMAWKSLRRRLSVRDHKDSRGESGGKRFF